MIPDSFIEELKERVDIEQIVAPYTTLKRRGRTLSGLCPFHSEKTPSFVVYPENGSFYCFGCGAGGDAVTFVRRSEHLEYIEALRFLADKAGIIFPEEGADDQTTALRRRILEINRAAARFFHEQLTSGEGKEALAYLRARGITDKTMRKFGLGWAPDSWDTLKKHLLAARFTEQEMLSAAVVRAGKSTSFDLFRGRVMFPIIDLRGNVIGFGGRVIGSQVPKYLNSSDTLVFKKSRGLYALNFAKSSGKRQILLTEGYMDTIALHQAGFDNTVATLGTALTGDQARLVAQYANEVVIAYDSDIPGQKATRRAAELFGETGLAVRVLSLEGAKDPDEYIKKFGADRFARLLEGSKSAAAHEIGAMQARFDLDSDDGRVAFLREFCPAMARLSNTIEADVYIGRISEQLSVSREAITTQVEALRKKLRRTKEKKYDATLKIFVQDIPGRPKDPLRAANMRYALAEDKLLVILLKNPDIYPKLKQRITPEDFVTDSNKRLYQVITARMETGRSTDMISLSGELTDEQMGWISYLLASDGARCVNAKDAFDCVEVILSKQTELTNEQVASMSPEELMRFVGEIAAKKNVGGHTGGGTGKERG